MQSKTFTFENMIIRVHRPELTPAERERRLKAIHNAAADLLKGAEHGKKN